MAKLTVNIGTSANDRTGDNLRTAFNKLNSNFDEIYLSVDTLTSQVATIQSSGTSNSASGNTIVGDIQGSVIAEDSTVLVDGVGGAIDAGNLTGALPAIDGSALTGVSASSIAFSNITSTPTTLSGYGISDAYTKAEVDSSFASVTAGHFDFNITGDDSTVRTVEKGDTLQIVGGTAITTASDADGNITINGVAQDFAFSSITGTPTTISGYGITDAVSTASPAFTGAVDFTGTTSVDFTGATINGLTVTETDPIVGAITGIVKADGSGNISAAVAGTDYLTTVAFADLTGKPTTISGYGITDAFDGAFGSLSGTPTTLSGYGITDAANTGSATTFTANVLFDTGVQEKFATLTGSTGVTAMDCDNGQVFYLTGAAGDITANFTNLGLTAEYGTNVTVIINQGATQYEVTAVQIGGVAQTIVWQGNSAPTGTANGVDSFSFTILNDGGTYVVLGQMVAFGGV